MAPCQDDALYNVSAFVTTTQRKGTHWRHSSMLHQNTLFERNQCMAECVNVQLLVALHGICKGNASTHTCQQQQPCACATCWVVACTGGWSAGAVSGSGSFLHSCRLFPSLGQRGVPSQVEAQCSRYQPCRTYQHKCQGRTPQLCKHTKVICIHKG